VSRKVRQEIFSPAPRSMRHTMHEQEWDETRTESRFLPDSLQPHTLTCPIHLFNY